jgi:hypothetical protein
MNSTLRQAQRSKRPEQLEGLWNGLLSRQPELIRSTFASLDTPNQNIVLAHLQRMVSEAGWQPEQRASAKVAIQVLDTQLRQEK